MFAYGVNKRSKQPCTLHATGIAPGGALETQLRKISGFPEMWPGFVSDPGTYMETFADKARDGKVVCVAFWCWLVCLSLRLPSLHRPPPPPAGT